MNIPSDLKYSKEHEWVEILENGNARIGISNYAQEALGDVVYVDMPAIGDGVRTGDSVGTIESVKAVSDIYCPLSGVITATNEEIDSAPDLVNKSPYGDGWLFELKMDDPAEMDNLLDSDGYQEFIESLD